MGYKKQSKRKSPFKAYGRSQKNAVRFDKLTDAQNNRNLLGQAVGAIGTSIGDAVQAFKDEKDQQETDAIIAGTPEGDPTLKTIIGDVPEAGKFDPNSVEVAEEELDPIDLGNQNSTQDPSNPTKKGQVKTYAQVGKDAYQQAINAGKTPVEAQIAQSTAEGKARNYNKTTYGTDAPTSEGKTNNYITSQTGAGGYVAGTAQATQGSTAVSSSRDSLDPLANPINRSPLRRMTPFLRSPFYATKGKKLGELAQSSLTNLSYLGQAGQAGAEGYNSQVDRHNYAQAVREEQAAELDEEFGELQVEPSGYKAYDASVEGLAREWKGEFVDAKKAWKAGKLSNEDWIDTKHRLQGNAASYGTASKKLQESMKSWIENKGNISNSTKPETIDFFNTMEKDPDRLTVQNIDGVPTFVGQTLGNQPISMPVDQIANGRAGMRFNTKLDIGKELAPTIKELQGLKTDIETKQGIGIGNQAWDTDAVQQKVNYNLDQIVNNNAKLRSIASEMGIDYDQFEERVAAGDDMKAEIKEDLRKQIQQAYFPVEKTVKTDQQLRNEGLLGDYRQKQIDNYGQGGGSDGTLSERENTRLTNYYTQQYNSPEYQTAFKDGPLSEENLRKFSGAAQIADQGDHFLFKKGGKVYRADKGDPQGTMRAISEANGLGAGLIDSAFNK